MFFLKDLKRPQPDLLISLDYPWEQEFMKSNQPIIADTLPYVSI